MILHSISIVNFRNITRADLDFSKGFNVLIGNNAQGKTNVLEAIYLLARGKSFRVSDVNDLLRWGEEKATVRGEILNSEGLQDSLLIEIQDGAKSFKVNEKAQLFRKYNLSKVVLFSPDEIFLLKSYPSERRRYLDNLISGFVPSYSRIVKDYEKVVSQRNSLLADGGSRDRIVREISTWNDRLIDLGVKIIMERREWIIKLGEHFSNEYGRIAPRDEGVRIDYFSRLAQNSDMTSSSLIDAFKSELNNRFNDEMSRRASLVGPHRDDMVVSVGNAAVKGFGSQGQVRTALLSMKISELKLHQQMSGSMPIFILDDVLSELDDERENQLINYLSSSNAQVFISTTEHLFDDKVKISDLSVFNVTQGKVARQS